MVQGELVQHISFRKLGESGFGVPFWLKLVALCCACISIYVQIAVMSKKGLMSWLAGLGAVLASSCWSPTRRCSPGKRLKHAGPSWVPMPRGWTRCDWKGNALRTGRSTTVLLCRSFLCLMWSQLQQWWEGQCLPATAACRDTWFVFGWCNHWTVVRNATAHAKKKMYQTALEISLSLVVVMQGVDASRVAHLI